jgi:hypothetical protein
MVFLLGCSSVKRQPRLRWRWWLGLLEVLVGGSGDAALEGADGLAGGVALGTAPLVVEGAGVAGALKW